MKWPPMTTALRTLPLPTVLERDQSSDKGSGRVFIRRTSRYSSGKVQFVNRNFQKFYRIFSGFFEKFSRESLRAFFQTIPRPLRFFPVRPHLLHLNRSREESCFQRIVASHKRFAGISFRKLRHLLPAFRFFRGTFPAVSENVHALADT